MSLNIKDSLEIVKRAGYGSGGIMDIGKTERRMANGERDPEDNPLLTREEIDSLRAAETDALDDVFEKIDLHRNPQEMTADQLLDVNDM